jgi:hypothetical protein
MHRPSVVAVILARADVTAFSVGALKEQLPDSPLESLHACTARNWRPPLRRARRCVGSNDRCDIRQNDAVNGAVERGDVASDVFVTDALRLLRSS